MMNCERLRRFQGRAAIPVFAVAILSFLFTACDATDPGFNFPRDIVDTYGDFPREEVFSNPLRSGPLRPTFDEVHFKSGNYAFTIRNDGVLENGEWNDHPENPDSAVATLFGGGIWMTGLQAGSMRANITRYTSNFAPAKLEHEAHSVYFFRPSELKVDPLNWPAILGAPLMENETPAVFGHLTAMAPTTTASLPDAGVYFGSGFEGVQVVQTVFAFDHFAVPDVFFVRYDITNRSGQPFERFRLSIFTDTDLDYRYVSGGSSPCSGYATYADNRTGFDLERKLSYTYSWPEGAPIDDPCLGVVSGYLILETRLEDGAVIQPGSHRIYRRNVGLERYFSENLLHGVEDLLLAAEGLSSNGEAMINPATGEATKWAFTGNPVDSTGWIDYPNDVRSLLSTEAFTLDPEQHVEMTAAWITARRPRLELALIELRRQADMLINYPSVWREPRSSSR